MCGPENVDYRIPRRGNPILLGYLPDYLEESIKVIQLGQERPSWPPLTFAFLFKQELLDIMLHLGNVVLVQVITMAVKVG
jgi:hypothetical protein